MGKENADALGILTGQMLNDLFEMVQEVTEEQIKPEEFAMRYVQPTMYHGRPSSSVILQEYGRAVEAATHSGSWRDVRLCVIRVAAAQTAESLSGIKRGDREAAWNSLSQAQFWLGTLCDIPKEPSSELSSMATEQATRIISQRARNAAAKAHAENRAIRDEAYAWLDEHFDREKMTVSRAAEALQKIVPVELSTRLTYVKNWKKSR